MTVLFSLVGFKIVGLSAALELVVPYEYLHKKVPNHCDVITLYCKCLRLYGKSDERPQQHL
jgi:hypothetical protein